MQPIVLLYLGCDLRFIELVPFILTANSLRAAKRKLQQIFGLSRSMPNPEKSHTSKKAAYEDERPGLKAIHNLLLPPIVLKALDSR